MNHSSSNTIEKQPYKKHRNLDSKIDKLVDFIKSETKPSQQGCCCPCHSVKKEGWCDTCCINHIQLTKQEMLSVCNNVPLKGKCKRKIKSSQQCLCHCHDKFCGVLSPIPNIRTTCEHCQSPKSSEDKWHEAGWNDAMEYAQQKFMEMIKGIMFMYEHQWVGSDKERLCNTCNEVVEKKTPCKSSIHYACYMALDDVLAELRSKLKVKKEV